MKHMKKWACLLLAMALLLLSGCGDAAQSSVPDNQEEEMSASALLQFGLPEEGDEIVVIHTSMGTLKVMLFPEIAPKAVAMAMGIAVTVLTILNALDVKSGMIMLGIGLACVGISLMSEKK